MATTITYATALSTAIAFMRANGFEDEEVLDKLGKLAAQKAPKGRTGKKSVARTKNDILARMVVDAMHDAGLTEIRAAWVRDNIAEVGSVARAVAVLNAAIDNGMIVREVVAKSATRSESIYRLA